MSQFKKLSNGYAMPIPGFGTSLRTRQSPGGKVKEAVLEAIRCGYRHIDTAECYYNEEEVGQALQAAIDDGIVKREELYICTKLAPSACKPERVRKHCLLSLEKLKTSYIDLYLIHFPISMSDEGIDDNPPRYAVFDEYGNMKTTDIDYVDTYKEMEKLVDEGIVHSLGISNFNINQIERVYNASRIKPVNLQVECHVWLYQESLIEFCKSKGITVTAYAPLGSPTRPTANDDSPQLLADPKVLQLATIYDKTPAQICLRYLIQRDIVPLPKSSTPERIKSNLQIFSFSLTNADMSLLIGNNKMLRLFSMLRGANKILSHPNYPWPDVLNELIQ